MVWFGPIFILYYLLHICAQFELSKNLIGWVVFDPFLYDYSHKKIIDLSFMYIKNPACVSYFITTSQIEKVIHEIKGFL